MQIPIRKVSLDFLVPNGKVSSENLRRRRGKGTEKRMGR